MYCSLKRISAMNTSLNHFLLALTTATFFASCGASPEETADTAATKGTPTACECVDHYKSKDLQLKAVCDELRQDETFDDRFRKCMAGSILGKDPDTVEFHKEGETQIASPDDGRFTFMTDRSRVIWTGRKVGRAHTGELVVKSGFVTFEGQNITEGQVIIDMGSLVNKDLKDAAERSRLEAHLKSDDFFDVDRYPDALFVVKNANISEGKGDITGTLTIKGKSESATLKNAVVARSGKNEVVIGGVLIFDRADYDVKFGSGRFFQNLGDALISDEVTLNITFRAKREATV